VNEPGRVERVGIRLAADPLMRQLTQRLVQHRHQLTQRLGVSSRPAVQQESDLRVVRSPGWFQGALAWVTVHDTWRPRALQGCDAPRLSPLAVSSALNGVPCGRSPFSREANNMAATGTAYPEAAAFRPLGSRMLTVASESRGHHGRREGRRRFALGS
jgi:hypothetical protein